MTKIDKVKMSLLLCSNKNCDECHYNRWVKEVCQTHLCKDALKVINGLQQHPKTDLEQMKFDI